MKTVFVWLARGIVGGVLLVSALSHVGNFHEFYANVLNYRLLPLALARAVAMIIPVLQLLVGMALLLDRFRRGAWGLAASMLAAFTFAQISAAVRGLNIECGCFGFYSPEISVISIAEVAGLLLIALIALGVDRYEIEKIESKNSLGSTQTS